jgi:hypothetical protein
MPGEERRSLSSARAARVMGRCRPSPIGRFARKRGDCRAMVVLDGGTAVVRMSRQPVGVSLNRRWHVLKVRGHGRGASIWLGHVEQAPAIAERRPPLPRQALEAPAIGGVQLGVCRSGSGGIPGRLAACCLCASSWGQSARQPAGNVEQGISVCCGNLLPVSLGPHCLPESDWRRPVPPPPPLSEGRPDTDTSPLSLRPLNAWTTETRTRPALTGSTSSARRRTRLAVRDGSSTRSSSTGAPCSAFGADC